MPYDILRVRWYLVFGVSLEGPLLIREDGGNEKNRRTTHYHDFHCFTDKARTTSLPFSISGGFIFRTAVVLLCWSPEIW